MIAVLVSIGVAFVRDSAPPGGGRFLGLPVAPGANVTYAISAMRTPSAGVTRRILMFAA